MTGCWKLDERLGKEECWLSARHGCTNITIPLNAVFYNGPWSLFCLCWKVLQTVVFEYLSTPCFSAKHCSNIPESTRYQRHNLWTISIITLKLDQRWYLMTLPNHLGISISVEYIDPEIRRWNCAVKAKLSWLRETIWHVKIRKVRIIGNGIRNDLLVHFSLYTAPMYLRLWLILKYLNGSQVSLNLIFSPVLVLSTLCEIWSRDCAFDSAGSESKAWYWRGYSTTTVCETFQCGQNQLQHEL
jgi:hypothetical protein